MRAILTILIAVLHVHHTCCQDLRESRSVDLYSEDYLEASQYYSEDYLESSQHYSEDHLESSQYYSEDYLESSQHYSEDHLQSSQYYSEDYLQSSQSDLLELQTSAVEETLETPLFSEESYLMTELPESVLNVGPSSVLVEPSDSLTLTAVSSVVDWEVISSALVEPTAVQPECNDREQRCAEIGMTVCTSYLGWAKYYCAKFCDLCDQMVATPPGELPMVTSQTGEVSSEVSPTTPEPTTTTEAATTTTEEPCCVDQLGWEQCINYRRESCQEPYRAWASQRCQAFCGMCRPCPIEPCEDATPFCDRYGEDSCTLDSYRKWALQNCRKHCGLCTNYGFYYIFNNITAPKYTDTPPTTVAPTTATTVSTKSDVECRDAVSHCAEYSKEDCDTYSGFMGRYCPKYCGLCSDSGTIGATQAAVHTQTSSPPSQSGTSETGISQTSGSVSAATSSSATEIPPNCGDVLSNCTSYPLDNCCGFYESWSRAHCAGYCGFCGRVPERVCEDRVNYCSQEPQDLCTNIAYTAWMLQNCAGFCNVCQNEPWKPPSCTAHLFQRLTDESLVG